MEIACHSLLVSHIFSTGSLLLRAAPLAEPSHLQGLLHWECQWERSRRVSRFLLEGGAMLLPRVWASSFFKHNLKHHMVLRAGQRSTVLPTSCG